MVYNTNKYSFINDKKQQDKIPNWMDDNFFDNLQNTFNNDVTTENFMTKTAKKYNLQNNKQCKCCGNTLNVNEVNFCKSCINNK